MNDNARLWVAALRSGKYTQWFYRLRRDGSCNDYKFCCLGVACDLYAQSTSNDNHLSWTVEDNGHLFNGSLLDLPDVVRDWLGLNTSSGGV